METNNDLYAKLRKDNDLHNEAINVFEKQHNLSAEEFGEKYSSDPEFEAEFNEYLKNYIAIESDEFFRKVCNEWSRVRSAVIDFLKSESIDYEEFCKRIDDKSFKSKFDQFVTDYKIISQ